MSSELSEQNENLGPKKIRLKPWMLPWNPCQHHEFPWKPCHEHARFDTVLHDHGSFEVCNDDGKSTMASIAAL